MFRKRITLPPYIELLLHVNTLALCIILTLIASLDLNELVSVYLSMTKEELATAIFKSFLNKYSIYLLRRKLKIQKNNINK